MDNLISSCCSEKAVTRGNTTKFYICDKCLKACDVISQEAYNYFNDPKILKEITTKMAKNILLKRKQKCAETICKKLS